MKFCLVNCHQALQERLRGLKRFADGCCNNSELLFNNGEENGTFPWKVGVEGSFTDPCLASSSMVVALYPFAGKSVSAA
nr:hypothetical protein [uncultured Desulfobulbus sp.]